MRCILQPANQIAFPLWNSPDFPFSCWTWAPLLWSSLTFVHKPEEKLPSNLQVISPLWACSLHSIMESSFPGVLMRFCSPESVARCSALGSQKAFHERRLSDGVFGFCLGSFIFAKCKPSSKEKVWLMGEPANNGAGM